MKMNFFQRVPWSDCLRERQNFRASMDVLARELNRVLTNNMRECKSKCATTTCMPPIFSCAALLGSSLAKLSCAALLRLLKTELKNDCACHQFARENWG